MTTAAALLTAVWFATAFLVRIAIQVRRTGDTGVRAHSPSRTAAVAKALFGVATLGVGAGPVLAALDASATLDGVGTVARSAGAALAAAGILATFVAQLEMGRSWRIGVDPGERTDLVTGGVFALVRNPIFSTMVVTSIGLTLMAPTALGTAATVVMLVALEVQVRLVEEPYLHRVHGSAYAAYVARVGRFVPTVGRR